MIFNPAVAGGGSTPESISFSLTFGLSKMAWEAKWRALENGEVVTKSSGSNPAQLSNISILKGTPITALVYRNGINIDYEGDGEYYTMFNTSDSNAHVYVIYPIDNGSGQFLML